MLQCGFVRANLALPIAAASYSVERTTTISKRRYFETPALHNAGAGDGNRTHVASLEGWSSTIELHPPVIRSARQANTGMPLRSQGPLGFRQSRSAGGGGRIRTYVGIRRQIYSLLPLTTRPPLRDRAPPVSRPGGRGTRR